MFVGHPTKLMEGAEHEAQIVHALVAWPGVSRLARPRHQRRIRAEHLCRNLGAISAISDRRAVPGRGDTPVCRPTARCRAAAHRARTHHRREPPKLCVGACARPATAAALRGRRLVSRHMGPHQGPARRAFFASSSAASGSPERHSPSPACDVPLRRPPPLSLAYRRRLIDR